MSGNWLRTSVAGLCLALCAPSMAAAQNEARSTSATLDTVVVTASRTEEKLREVTSNVTVITEEMIKKSSASDMSQLLRQQGIDVSGTLGGGAGMRQIRLRGMAPTMDSAYSTGDVTGSATLVLLNGRRVNSPSPDFIGLTNVERIEIIRGPAAVQYGPSAMAGVVNIITKRGSEKTEIRAEAGAGSYELERFKLAASGQSETGLLDVSFGAGQQYRGDYKTGEGWVWDGTRTGNQLGFNGDLGINFREGHRIGFNYNYSGTFGAEANGAEASYTNPSLRPPVYDINQHWTSYDYENSNVAVTYDGSTEDKAWNWQGRVSFGRDETTFLSWGDFWRKTTTNTNNLTAILGYDDGGLFALSGGLDNVVYDIKNAGKYVSPAENPEYKDFGAFLSGKLRFLEDSLIFSAGGRFDSYDIEGSFEGTTTKSKMSETNFSPSLGLAWLPVDWVKLRGNFSQGFRMPSPSQFWGVYDYGSSKYVGNPDLKPEKSKTWEVGLDVSWEFTNASLTYFRTKWEDKIMNRTIPGTPPTRMPVNILGATIAGYELALSADLGQAFQKDFTLRPYINLTYLPTLRNEDTEDVLGRGGRDTLPYTSKMTMSYGLDFVEPNIDLMVNVNANYAGEMLNQDTSPGWGNPGYGAWVYHTPGTLVDMSIEQGIREFADMGKLKVRAEVNNILDRYYVATPGYPLAGRNFYVGLVYNY